MKYTKDYITNQPSDATIEGVIEALWETFGDSITHIAVAIPLASNAEYVSAGSTPSSRTLENFYAKWCTTIRAKGWKVLHRGALPGMEGLYNFTHQIGASRISPGDSNSTDTTTHLGKIYTFMTNNTNSNCFVRM